MSSAPAADGLLVVRDLRKEFWLRERGLRSKSTRHAAVDGVSFAVQAGRTLGLIGESGSGKSTTARCIVRMIEPTSGSIVFDGVEVTTLGRRELWSTRRQLQIVFQNPYASLDPRRSVGSSIAEPLVAYGIGSRASRTARTHELLEQVGLRSSVAKQRPSEFSGGERQRIAIARALAPAPALVVCDEPVSALDVSVQAQILNLLRDLQDRLGLTYVFISHDIGVIATMSDEIAVMKDGRIVESGPTDDVRKAPRHPYTRALLDAAKQSDPSPPGEG